MSEDEKIAREIVTKWIWDCGDSLSLSFIQSELLQQRIVEAIALSGAGRGLLEEARSFVAWHTRPSPRNVSDLLERIDCELAAPSTMTSHDRSQGE